MSLPTAYTETTAAEFMHADLGPVAGELDWTVAGGSYAEAVNELLVLCGVVSLTGVAVAKVRVLARVAAWRQVVNHTAGDFAFTADGASYSRQQFHQQARERLARIENDAATAGHLDLYKVTSDTLEYVNDPYAVTLDDPRNLGKAMVNETDFDS